MTHQPSTPASRSLTTHPARATGPSTADYKILTSEPDLEPLGKGQLRLPLDQSAEVLLQLGLARKAKLGPAFGPDSRQLTMALYPQSATRLRIDIENSHRQAWKVPESIVPRFPPKQPFKHSQDAAALDYDVIWNDTNSFSFTVIRKATGEKLFDTSSLGLTMQDQYLELSTHLVGGSSERAANLFGLGENVGQLRRKLGTTTTLWARDCPCRPDINLYSCHPFYMEVLPSGSAHGVLLLSSNGMDVVLSPEGDRLTYKVIGGAVELYIFTGPTPQRVIQQYTELIGRPCMIPYYAQGFHMCRWGYDTLDKVKTIVANFKKHQLPLEVMWIDIDYMKDYKCFTFDEERFPIKQLGEYVDELHAQDQKMVMILDPGIKVQYETGLYEPYDEGVAKNLFVKRRVTKYEEREDGTKYYEGDLVDFVGKVWPGKTTFPDWFHPETQSYWTKYVTRWLQQVPLDGIWIDMNEAASFHDGDCSHIASSEDRPVRVSDFALTEADSEDGEGAHMLQPQHAGASTKEEPVQSKGRKSHINLTQDGDTIQPKDVIAIHERQYENAHDPHHLERVHSGQASQEIVSGKGSKPPVVYHSPNDPPYRINNNSEFASLEYRTISADALHHEGITEYDAHNLYGHMEGIATYKALRAFQPDNKPFILSRSTFPGSGRFVCKWNGDNWSSEYDLKASIAGLLNFQFFGIPMVGADIGGFGDVASEELLIRWHQLGAFYPFMRNHNCLPNPPQEPYVTKPLANVTRAYVDMRYRLLPYWYTLFYRAHQSGRMVCSPLWILDPTDHDLLSNDEQFLVGEAILVSPVLKLEQTSVQARFPAGRWYDLHSGLLEVYVQDKRAAGTHSAVSQVFKMDAPLESIPVHVRGGHILPRAEFEAGTFIQTTAQVRKAPLEVLVALDETECASGEYYHDDDTLAPKDGTLVKFQARPGMMTMSSFAANKIVDPLKESRTEGSRGSTAPVGEDTDDLLVPHGSRDLRPTFVQSVLVWGVGMNHVGAGKVDKKAAKSSCQVEAHQVRVSIARAVGAATASVQHQRELRAVASEDVAVEWDASRAQLAVRFRRAGGLALAGDEALEVDWTEALVA
ncbi:alpha-glucosidase maltase [Dissophora globulifera]|uniref:Maltase n=1 Tax=Dissophora globulifera TaxID=979702 RepID=A0A9P6UU23_9FUNG|nr:alpha-glucosidase maltase [Dissophora globulifera]